jgi:hypothetical protein
LSALLALVTALILAAPAHAASDGITDDVRAAS